MNVEEYLSWQPFLTLSTSTVSCGVWSETRTVTVPQVDFDQSQKKKRKYEGETIRRVLFDLADPEEKPGADDEEQVEESKSVGVCAVSQR